MIDSSKALRTDTLTGLLHQWVELKDLLGADSYDGIEPKYVLRLDQLASVTRAALQQPAAEPVAWRWRWDYGTDAPRRWTLAQSRRFSQPAKGSYVAIIAEPLYASPIPEPAAEPVAEGVCMDCRRCNPVWFAPNKLWNLVIGGPDAKDDPGGFYCPVCFIERAEKVGIAPTAWMVAPESPATTDVEREEIARHLFDRFRATPSAPNYHTIDEPSKELWRIEADQIKALFASKLFAKNAKKSVGSTSQPQANGSPDPILTDGQHSDGEG